MDYLNVCKIAYEAGNKIEEIYKRDFSVHIKDDNSPLNEADLESHRIIINGLKNKYSILSEKKFIDANLFYNYRVSIT